MDAGLKKTAESTANSVLELDPSSRLQAEFNEPNDVTFKTETIAGIPANSSDNSSSNSMLQYSRFEKEFQILANLGKGGFGRVYKALYKFDGSLYAIKQIKNEKLKNSRLTKEVDVLSKLNHQNVVRYYTSWIENLGSGDSSGGFRMYIQMEYCEKSTLGKAIQDNLYADQDKVWRWIKESIDGLIYIHSEGIIHRDLKPNNIFIDGDDHVKIGDFGLATLINVLQGDVKSSHTAGVGTELYDAPELKKTFNGQKAHYNQKIDMYSLGIIFFEMCRPPFKTHIERYSVLRELRDSSIKIVPCLDDGSVPKRRGRTSSKISYYPNDHQSQLIRELLNHDPEKRPTARDILKKGYHLVNKQYKNSNTKRFTRNNNNFENGNISTSRLAYLEYDDKNVRKANFLEFVIEKAREIFLLHGAIYSPSCLPSDSKDSPASYHHSLSFAHYFVSKRITHMKRYTVNEMSYESSFMKSSDPFRCVRFDIVSPSAKNLTMEVEGILVVREFLERFAAWDVHMSDYVIRLNHGLLVRHVIEHLQKLRNKRAKKRDHMGHVVNSEESCIKFAMEEYESLPSIHDLSINEWKFIENDNVHGLENDPLLLHIFHLKRNAWKSKQFYKVAFDDLKRLVDLLKNLKIQCPIVIAPSLMMENSKYSEIMFQIVRKDSIYNGAGVIAAGGRYNALIGKCKADLKLKRSAKQSAVGLSIYLDQLVEIIKPEKQKGPLAKFEVFVCSNESDKLTNEKLKLANELWAAEIPCTISHVDYKGLEEIQGYCREMRVPHILYIEESDTTKVTLCTWSSDRFITRNFAVSEIIPHLRKTIKH